MTYLDLLAELARRKALIVHCLRLGKGDEGNNAVLFPQDMINAIALCDTCKTELCCSVVWPGHLETFGDIGIVLRPRSTSAITMICTTDGGTCVDPKTGRRVGAGSAFSDEMVAKTFANPTGYNEWNIDDADVVAIYMKSLAMQPQVATFQDITKIEGYDPILGEEPIIGQRSVSFAEIFAVFPGLPIVTIEGNEIVDVSGRTVSLYE